MIQFFGYAGLSLNLISMSMKRILSLAANALYIVYGVMLDAPPIFIGCSTGVVLHSYRIYKTIAESSKKNLSTHEAKDF